MRRRAWLVLAGLALLGRSASGKDRAALAADAAVRGKAALDDGRLGDAEKLFRQAVELAPDRPGPHFFLGKTLVLEKDCASGEQELRAYLRITARGRDVREAETLLSSCAARAPAPVPPERVPMQPAPEPAPAPAPAAPPREPAAPSEPTRILVENTLYAGAGAFITSGAYGGEVSVAYGLNPRWDVTGSYLFGASSTTANGKSYDINVHVVRMRATYHFPRDSRLQPFLGAALLIDHVVIQDGTGTLPGFTIEPGIVLAITGYLRLFAELPVGFVFSRGVSWHAGATVVTTEPDAFFGGFAAGVQLGGTL